MRILFSFTPFLSLSSYFICKKKNFIWHSCDHEHYRSTLLLYIHYYYFMKWIDIVTPHRNKNSARQALFIFLVKWKLCSTVFVIILIKSFKPHTLTVKLSYAFQYIPNETPDLITRCNKHTNCIVNVKELKARREKKTYQRINGTGKC